MGSENMKLKLKNVGWIGDYYYAQDGSEYAYYGKGAIKINGKLAICYAANESHYMHEGSWSETRHNWMDVLTGEDIRISMKSGFVIEDSLVGTSFRKVHKPHESNPW